MGVSTSTTSIPVIASGTMAASPPNAPGSSSRRSRSWSIALSRLASTSRRRTS
jgi:hypothetical protein